MAARRPIRVLVAKPGLDSHDRGAKVLARAFRDAGFEVIYTGLHRTPQEIAQAAVQEDVDVVAMSILSGAHDVLVPKIIRLVRDQGGTDVLFLAGGVIPDEDVPKLVEAGCAAVFGPGSDIARIIEFIREHAPVRVGP